MLHAFLATNKTELIALCKSKAAVRRMSAKEPHFESGIPSFLNQLIATLELEEMKEPSRSLEVSGPSGGGPVPSEIGDTAADHGRELMEQGYTAEQVVHDYGDLCQAITEMASTQHMPIRVEEFHTLNRCLDNGIAGAVTGFGRQRDFIFSNSTIRSSNERLGFLGHELRNFIHVARLSVAALKMGFVGTNGATSALLERSLDGMSTLIDRTLSDVRATAGLTSRPQIVSLAGFVEEAGHAASLEAGTRECGFSIADVDPKLGIEVDRDLLFSAVGNLLQNAFKFTHPHSSVGLKAYCSGDRIFIDVEDRCGGLPEGNAATIFEPFQQGGENKSGLGLGLSICKRVVEANKGVLSVHDMPGVGCVFRISLPAHALPDPAPLHGVLQ